MNRGDHLEEVVITVPVSGRADAEGGSLGNMVSPMLVAVPATGPLDEAVARVRSTVGQHRSSATGPPPIALLGWLFRPLAAAGGYRWYMNHQHRFHTVVSHLRGPAETLHLGGHAITSAIPVGMAEGGNVPVYFQVLSYAEALTISVVVDPEHFPEADELTQALDEALTQIAAAQAAGPQENPATRWRRPRTRSTLES